MPLRSITTPRGGFARRILLVALATMLVIATMAIVPGGAYGAQDTDATQEPQGDDPDAAVVSEDDDTAEPTTTVAAPTDESTTTTSEAPVAELTTATEPAPTTTVPEAVDEPTTTTVAPPPEPAAPLTSDVPPTLTLSVLVVNDDGGLATPPEFSLSATGSSGSFIDVASVPVSSVGDYTTGATPPHTVDAGVQYTLGYVTAPLYTEVGSGWACSVDNVSVGSGLTSIVLNAGETADCKISVSDPDTTLQMIKVVDNTGGGSATNADWQLTATSLGSDDAKDQDHAGNYGPFVPLFANTEYQLGEYGGPGGYTAGSWSCEGGTLVGSVLTVPTGGAASCTIVNTYDAQGTPDVDVQLGTSSSPTGPFADADTAAEQAVYTAGSQIYLEYSVENVGDVPIEDFYPVVLNLPASVPAPDASTPDSGDTDGDGVLDPLETWVWVLPSTASAGLTEAEAWVTDTTGSLIGVMESSWYLGTDEVVPVPPTLTLVKTVINDNGGSQPPTAWTLTADGSSGGFSGPGEMISDTQASITDEVDAGVEYTLSEDGPVGYAASSWECVVDGGPTIPGNTISLQDGQSASCFVTNNDIAPMLSLYKEVINDDGGTALAEEWVLSAWEAGGGGFSELAIRIDDTNAVVADQELIAFESYALGESGPGAYEAAAEWVCTIYTAWGIEIPATARSFILLSVGDRAECTITNDDIAPTLTLDKYVVNDDGGTATADQWTLSADGSEGGFSGTGDVLYTGYASLGPNPVAAGVEYTISESGGPSGYSAGSWRCFVGDGPDFAVDGPITLNLGEEWTCWVVNDDLLAAIDIEVSTNGDDADSPTGPVLTAGDAVAWEYVVTNPGGPSLSDVVVTDDQGVAPVYQSGDTDTNGMLDPGETWVFAANGTAIAGQYANNGTATATAPAPQVACLESADGDASLQSCSTGASLLEDVATIPVSDTDPSHYLGEEMPPPPEEPPPPAEEEPAPPPEDVPVVVTAAAASLGDTVWDDAHGNGTQDAGEAGISGVKVTLTLPDATTLTATTDANGQYLFTDLEPGTYTVELELTSVPEPSNGTLEVTTAASYTLQLQAGDNNLDSDFGVTTKAAAVVTTTQETLPNTGIDTTGIALFALALLLAGLAALFATSRTREDGGDLTA